MTSRDVSLEPNTEPESDYFCGVHRSILEAFDNLGWSDDIPPTEEPLEWFLPSRSHAMKLIESELALFPTKEYNIPHMTQNEDSLGLYLPGLPPNHQTCLPKKSVLTNKEQRKLFDLYHRMTLRNKRPLSEKELSDFQVLRAKAAGEHAQFQEFAMSEWCKGQCKRTLIIPQEIDLYIEQLWKMKAKQCLNWYPDDYKRLTQIPLVLNDPNQDYTVMDLVKYVHRESLPPKMALPRVKKRYDLLSKFEDLVRIKPVTADLDRPKPLTRTVPPVSFNPVVDDLLMQDDLDIDVVISMSGIKTLIDNIKFQKEWVLPVTVKNILKSDGETKKKVVIIDKNLPPKRMSVHEKNLWHAKIVSKWMLVLNQFPNLFTKIGEQSEANGNHVTSYTDMLNEVVEKINKEKSAEKVEEKDKATSNKNMLSEAPKKQILKKSPENGIEKVKQLSKSSEHLICHEKQKTAGTAQSRYEQWSSSKKLQARPSQQRDLRTKIEESKNPISYDDPFSNCIVEDFEEFGVDPGPKRNIKTVKASQEEAGCSKSFFEISSDKKSPEIEASSGCRPRIKIDRAKETATNGFERPVLKPTASRKEMQSPSFQYQLWKLHKLKSQKLLKCEQRSINLLVRSRTDGNLSCYRDGARVFDDVYVSSKLEFQPEYGASKMTVSELTREYLDLFMRPTTNLVRVRSIGHTKEVMMAEVKTLSEIKEALQGEGHQVHKLFDSLYAVLTKLIDLNPGRYMLQHTAKMGAFATLLVEHSGCRDFSLPEYCSELIKGDVNVLPMPIDHLVLTALQYRDHVPPALFTPLFSHENKPKDLIPGKASLPAAEWKKNLKRRKKTRRLNRIKERKKLKRETSKDSTSGDSWVDLQEGQ